MKRKSKKMKQSLRLHGELVESSFDELALLEFRPGQNNKTPLLKVLDTLVPNSQKIK